MSSAIMTSAQLPLSTDEWGAMSLRILANFAQRRLGMQQIPDNRWDLEVKVGQYLKQFRDVADCYSGLFTETDSLGQQFTPHLASEPEALGKRFATLNHISPNAHSLLDLGAGTGYALRCALELGYDAIGVEIDEAYANTVAERLRSAGHDSCRIIKGDFLADTFADTDLNGKRVGDFDAVCVFAIDIIMWKAMNAIPKHMRPGSHIVFGGFSYRTHSSKLVEYATQNDIPVVLEQEYYGDTYCLRRV